MGQTGIIKPSENGNVVFRFLYKIDWSTLYYPTSSGHIYSYFSSQVNLIAKPGSEDCWTIPVWVPNLQSWKSFEMPLNSLIFLMPSRKKPMFPVKRETNISPRCWRDTETTLSMMFWDLLQHYTQSVGRSTRYGGFSFSLWAFVSVKWRVELSLKTGKILSKSFSLFLFWRRISFWKINDIGKDGFR